MATKSKRQISSSLSRQPEGKSMRRSPITIARDARSNKFILYLAAAASAAFALTIFAGHSTAQTPETACPDALMRLSEAGTGVLLLKSDTPGCFLPAPRVVADYAVDIAGPIARTRVTQRFENPADGWVEGVYVFPLPEKSAVDTLKMKIGERFIEGQIKERGQARQIYEAARAEGRKASLVEQERPNIFTNNVANIGPHESIAVQIEYQESLRFDQGRYQLRVPLVVAPRFSPPPRPVLAQFTAGSLGLVRSDPVPDRDRLAAPVVRPEWGKINPVSLTVNLDAGFPLGDIASDSHKLSIVRNGRTAASVGLAEGDVPSDRDFTFSFTPAASTAPVASLLKEHVGDSDYLLALVVPPGGEARSKAKPREAIFILDNSGSMAGESIREARASLLLALDRLTPADRFNVIRFDDTMTVFFPSPVNATPENVARAKAYVGTIEARGGTVMLPALLAALNDPTPEDRTRLRQVIFLTDGAVGNEAELFNAINERLGRSRLFTVGIGSAPNAYLMSGAARAGRGTYTYISAVDQVSERMAELFAKLEHPVMTELAARWPGGVSGESWPNPLPDLYAGEPVVLIAKIPSVQGNLVLSGNFEGAPWQATLDLTQARDAKDIEKLWARNKIAALDDSRVHGFDAGEIDHAVLDVALEHHLTSRLTSLVAVDVTPSRPIGDGLNSARVPLNLPNGWVYDKVFGEQAAPSADQHAQALPPPTPPPAAMPAPAAMTRLAMAQGPKAAVKPADQGVTLPQTGSEGPLMLIAGLTLLLLAGALMLRERSNAGVSR
jgi:Ca-activated chloride channel family protein